MPLLRPMPCYFSGMLHLAHGMKLLSAFGLKPVGRPHHWVTPFLGKCGQIGLSRHNFASTAPFPDLSTPLDSLYFSGSHGVVWVEIGAVSGRQFWKNGMLRWKSGRCFPLPSPNSEIEMPADV